MLVTDFELSTDASINHDAREPRFQHDDVKVYSFYSRIELQCKVLWPDDRKDHPLSLTIYGEAISNKSFSAKLHEFRERDKDGSLKFRKSRGQLVPVYKPPNGIGTLEKVRGKMAWRGVAWVSPEITSDMISLVVNVSPLYASIHEMKKDRIRWIVGLTIQTSDPVE